jgi:protease-4
MSDPAYDPNSPHNPRPYVVNTQPNAPLRIMIEQAPTRGFARLFRWLLMPILVLSLLMNMEYLSSKHVLENDGEDVQEKYFSQKRDGHDKVAILTIEGTILHSDGFVKKQIEHALKDKDLKALVVRVDSPGGTVTGSDYIYHHLKKLIADKKIPMVVSMGGIAASGGYYVAMAAGDKEQTIYAEPTTWTGSIGVIIPHYDVSKLLEHWDIADDSISSHPLKQMGSFTHQVSKEERDEERAILKGLVDDSFGRFKEIVLASRPALRNNADWQAEVFTGRIFAADQAKANGLVDELGYVEDAIDRAIQLAGLSKEHVRVVKYSKPSSVFDQLTGGSASESASRSGLAKADLAALFDMLAPRAFYLCSWAPALGGRE